MPKLTFKKSFRKEIVSDYIKLLKDNTANIYIINHQAEIVAFAYKKYKELVSSGYEDTEELRTAIFDDTWTVIAEFFPIIGTSAGSPAIKDVEKTFQAFTDDKLGFPDEYVHMYYYNLNNNTNVNLTDLYTKYCLLDLR